MRSAKFNITTIESVAGRSSTNDFEGLNDHGNELIRKPIQRAREGAD